MSTKQVPLSPREEEIAKKIVSAAFNVHQHLGPGLLEKIYETCFCYELSKYGLHYRQQVEIPITYDNIVFDAGLRLDILVEDLVICELKAVTEMNPVFQAQILSYLKIAEKRLGFLINFNVPLIRDGIQRIIL
ncbi:MAG TPA: GxxExxY protein [Candidatus Marinimicrobia bacterium]|nr:GxxExxY protein [Candidatus Neomarinimicrobiota bacterium]HOV23645.1 GxxExxY protein [Candidatus Neomarinimicrobiota bacterium]HQH56138.1 GxxExxY protein [Candidatus Neomarinimicrobiota bacterium]HQK11190.1 GxxExxY protein [Candidatus Neomarinimicrobiota bacterium]HRD18434.1 GxxExxY protein [Candidatus Neomarinimicrobiota bacterium]